MKGKETIAAALMVGMLTLNGCKPADNASQTQLPNPTKIEQSKEASLREQVLAFSWKDAEDPERLKAFVESLADGYISLTNTTRITKQKLLSNTNFYNNREDYLRAVRTVNPSYSAQQAAFTHYKTERVFFDLATHEKYIGNMGNDLAGLFITSLLWHEWGHLDVTERTTGENINNRNYFFRTPNGRDEMYKRYRGGEILTETYFGYRTFEEVLNETINIRRISEQLGIPFEGRYRVVMTTSDYYPNGVDVFFPFTRKHIPLQDLYTLHAASDFEGLARKVGEYIPGEESAFNKGERLFIAFNKADPNLIRQAGLKLK